VLKNEKKISFAPNDNLNWQTYRTRFTVRARTLSTPLSFIDGLGREQTGKPGDYLVESNGVVTITPRRIFEDVYVTLEPGLADGRQPIADAPPVSPQFPQKRPATSRPPAGAPINRTVTIPMERRT
jgi:hypothetical protein